MLYSVTSSWPQDTESFILLYGSQGFSFLSFLQTISTLERLLRGITVGVGTAAKQDNPRGVKAYSELKKKMGSRRAEVAQCLFASMRPEFRSLEPV